MEYRRLGRCGLKLSALSLGTATFGDSVDVKAAREFVAASLDAGINHFDTAEVYAGSRSEQVLGEVLADLKPSRLGIVVSTKFALGLSKGPNSSNTLNRKYLLDAIDGSLQRLKLDHVDLVYCHWPDRETPIEETIWALHNLIERGKALYWGTSNFTPEQIRAAWDIAERHHLHKPVVEQSEYNLLFSSRVKNGMKRLIEDTGLGVTAYSPLAGGVLSGKYRQGAAPGSRATDPKIAMFHATLLDQRRNEIAGKLGEIAADIGTSLAAMALAWCLTDARISSVILGVTKPDQLAANLAAMAVLPKLTPEVLARIDGVLDGYDQSWMPYSEHP